MGPDPVPAKFVPWRGRRCAMPKGSAPPPPPEALAFRLMSRVTKGWLESCPHARTSQFTCPLYTATCPVHIDEVTIPEGAAVRLAAQASYFDGLLTHETRLERAFENAMSLIRALGGYRDSGRSGGDGVIGVLRGAMPGSSI